MSGKKRKKEGLLILLLSRNLQNHAYRRKKKNKAFKMSKISTVNGSNPTSSNQRKRNIKGKKAT